MGAFLAPIAALIGAILFFAWISVMIWMGNRQAERLRALAQEERYRRIELNLPEVDPVAARLESDKMRNTFIGVIGLLVPLGICLALVIVTVVTAEGRRAEFAMPVLTVAWPAGMVVALVTALVSMQVLRRGIVPTKADNVTPPAANNEEKRSAPTGILDKPPERFAPSSDRSGGEA
jgi:hypothetical protein